MARIRTIKPEFWEDETVGVLARDARLLFIATWNLADDEGLLRWTAPYIKATVFMYDDDLDLARITSLMDELVHEQVIFPYVGGKTQQRLAYVVNFHKHQKINRPGPGRLPPPSIQSPKVRAMYARRDRMTCYLCNEPVNDPPKVVEHYNPSLDHVVARNNGGSDYPSNIRLAHCRCNKSKGDRLLVDQEDLLTEPFTDPGCPDSLNDSLNDSHDQGRPSVNSSLPEQGTGNREQGRTLRRLPSTVRVQDAVDTDPDFMTFWAAYPRREAKGNARRAWRAALSRGVDPKEVIRGAERYRDNPLRMAGGSKYTAHPATWLNGDRWLDQPPDHVNGSGSAGLVTDAPWMN
jgi:HNH endonuclease